ncbi:hypothetical protein CKAH01_06319 [Colletotrichum kahawae]|uniref:Uncharacterized protein n=1 Tax=Colletotrichum kahawae TaxID=34407 RepID=A0AAD9YAI7_COLKA|nr:hypothetical protein CKAH01_06319 [Colletotrichum kahawae]
MHEIDSSQMSKQTDARESEPTSWMESWKRGGGIGDADAGAEVPKDAPTVVVVWISDKALRCRRSNNVFKSPYKTKTIITTQKQRSSPPPVPRSHPIQGGGEGRDREEKAGPGKGASTSILASHPSKPVLRAIRNRRAQPVTSVPSEEEQVAATIPSLQANCLPQCDPSQTTIHHNPRKVNKTDEFPLHDGEGHPKKQAFIIAHPTPARPGSSSTANPCLCLAPLHPISLLEQTPTAVEHDPANTRQEIGLNNPAHLLDSGETGDPDGVPPSESPPFSLRYNSRRSPPSHHAAVTVAGHDQNKIPAKHRGHIVPFPVHPASL